MKKYDQQTNKHIAEKKLFIHEEICFLMLYLEKNLIVLIIAALKPLFYFRSLHMTNWST